MKKIGSSFVYILFLAMIVASVSCKKDTPSASELSSREQNTLTKYIQDHNITTPPSSSGLYYLPTDSGSGISPDTNDIVIFNYTLRLLNGTVLLTNVDSIATAHNLSANYTFMKPFEYRVTWWFKGLIEGFQLMKEGGKASFIIPSDLAYGSAGAPSLNIPGFTTIIFDISLLKVVHDPIAYEKMQIQNILDTIPQTKIIDPLDSGVYHITDVPGTGDYAVDYKTMSIHYVAMLLDGTVIESVTGNQTPFSYTLKTDNVIQGFYIAMKHMKKGESAWIIIPYKQAYGERPQYFMPFATLLYYITVEDIQ